MEFEVHEREAGESKWSTWSLIKYAFTNIVAFTTAPLQFVTVGGGICFGCSLIMIIYSLIQYFRGQAIEGYTTTILLTASDRKCDYAESWCDWLLPCKDL